MNKRWLLFDMSAVLWQNLLAGKDKEGGREVAHPTDDGKVVWVNSAEFGFDNFVNNLGSLLHKFDAAPRDVVMVFDGKNSKLLRQQIHPEYKAGRDKTAEIFEQFEKLRERVKVTLLSLGALAVWQDGMEADDVLCYLSQNLRSKRTIVSNDGDMLVLHGPDTDIYRTGADELNTNKYGPFPHRFITLYKALVGDTSDNIKGAKGFGPKAFIDLYCTFREEGLESMEELIVRHELHRLAEDVGELKSLQKIIDYEDSVYMSWSVARMFPEKVNTARAPLQVTAGMVCQWDPEQHDMRLKQWYGAQRIVHADSWVDACAWAMEKLLESPEVSIDIETSTPPESDEWLEAKKRSTGGEDGGNLGVDVLGSKLTGLSITFGRNCQYSFYLPVDHVETPDVGNVSSEQVRKLIELIPISKPLVVQNSDFELSVLYQEWGKAWESNGWHGFLPNVYDTKRLKSFVDENTRSGLKDMSKAILGYDQVSYADVTKGRKMNQMTAEETVAYGNDDTICTVALFNYLRFSMEIEDSMRIYEEVGRKPAYLNALRFVQGTPISMERLFDQEKADAATAETAWATVRTFLLNNGWEGTVCPRFEKAEDFTPAAIKEAYLLCTGEELKTQVRTPAKIFKLIEAAGADLLAGVLTSAYESGGCGPANDLLKINFKGEPEFNPDSSKHMQKLLYDVLKLPVRLRNKPTDVMRAKGIKEGNPRADDFALEFAIKFDAERGEEMLDVLKAIQTMRVMATRSKLYYVPYRHMRHWKTNLVHSQVNQFSTVTRRDSDSGPNKQQLGKNTKHGHKPRIREVFVPHHKDAVVVSLDFEGQELRGIAEQSQDPNMLACFVGDDLKDIHVMTGAEIWRKKPIADLCKLMGMPLIDKASARAAAWVGITYDKFIEILGDEAHPDHRLAKELRQIGKKVNFTTEYGAQAPKLAETLIITPEEGQQYIDAKEATFPRAAQWKRDVIAEAHRVGYSTTLFGARRHLREALLSTNRFDVMKAERRAVNFKIQSSAAEQTKLAEARLWERGVYFRYDARYIGPVHDELVSSCAVRDLVPFIREKHACMTADYAGIKVPIVAAISFGRSYGEQIEVGKEPNEERIREALQQLGFASMLVS